MRNGRRTGGNRSTARNGGNLTVYAHQPRELFHLRGERRKVPAKSLHLVIHVLLPSVDGPHQTPWPPASPRSYRP